MLKRRIAFLMAGALLLGSAAAVSAEETQESQVLTADEAVQRSDDHLTVGTTTAFDGYFFTDMWSNVSSDIDVRALVHGYDLVEWNSKETSFGIDPSVVSSVTVNKNENGDKTYLLSLYDDLKYCDGTPITAKDYAFTMLLSISPEAEEIGATVKDMSYLAGYDAYIAKETPYLAGVRILNDYTLSFTISHEYLPFFYEQALLDCTPYPISRIAPGCVVKDDGSGVYIANEDETAEEPVFTAALLQETILNEETGYMSHPDITSGPYRLVSYDGASAEFEINEYYKGNSKGNTPSIPKLTFKVVQNDTMMEELENGSVDLLNRCTAASALEAGLDLISRDADIALSNYPRRGLSFISFCCEQPQVSSEAVRKAIAMCMDKEAMVKDYAGSFGTAAEGYYGIGQWMYEVLSGSQPIPEKEPDDNDEKAKAEYEAVMARWDALSLDSIPSCQLDTEGAAALLEADGWTLNKDGEAFDPAKDDIRCKEIDGELTALDLTILVPEGNAIHESMEKNFIPYLQEAGIALHIELLPLSDLLRVYYNQEERSCQMIYLATNFDIVYDPSLTFRPVDANDAAQNTHNTTRLNDQQLYDLAVDMRRTEPGDAISYCEKWITFQQRFSEVLPLIPVYSNAYFDFYTRSLQNYNIQENISWGKAIVDAHM